MRVISVVSGKGGVGKTTIVAGIGSTLASELKKNVLLIDCNITTAHLGLYMGIENHGATLNHVITGKAKVRDAIYGHFSGAKVMPSSLALKDLSGIDIANIKHVVGKVRRELPEIDIVLLDCAPGFGREAMAGIRASEEVIFVTTPYLPCIMDIIKCGQVAAELEITPLGVIVNMQKKDKHEMSTKDIESLTDMKVLAEVPFHHDATKSLHARVPVTAHRPKSKVSRAIRKVSHAVAGTEFKEGGIFIRILQIFK